MTTLQTLSIILTASIFSACGGQEQTDKIGEQKPVSNHLDKLPDLKKIVDRIERGNSVESSHIGEGGEPSEQYEKYEQLKEAATVDQLADLTDHKNAAVRCYAFQALASKHSDKVFPILLNHLSDTAQVQTQSGCLVFNMYVGDYFVDVVTPEYIDHNLYKLNKNERKTLDSILVNDKSVLISSRPK